MPPSRRSSSSRSSRSRSSSRSSSRRSRSSHSSSSYTRSSYRSSQPSYRPRTNQPTNIPAYIRSKSIRICCKNHDYIYYNEPWLDNATGRYYQKGYYDEAGGYYGADDIAFKRPDGSYVAHYQCEFCGTESENVWKEGFYPTCKNCGAQMNKTPVFIDDIIEVNNKRSGGLGIIGKVLLIYVLILVLGPLIFLPFASILIPLLLVTTDSGNEQSDIGTTQYEYVEDYDYETNLQIYGDNLYLDEIDENIYQICEETDEYEKHLTWDYGSGSYYDYESNCYIWYNTDVAPNLWQYWYDDIAGDSYYGWMECEGTEWYIEVSDTDWERYNGDTSELWHIQNPFDE